MHCLIISVMSFYSLTNKWRTPLNYNQWLFISYFKCSCCLVEAECICTAWCDKCYIRCVRALEVLCTAVNNLFTDCVCCTVAINLEWVCTLTKLYFTNCNIAFAAFVIKYEVDVARYMNIISFFILCRSITYNEFLCFCVECECVCTACCVECEVAWILAVEWKWISPWRCGFP